ncbi:MAG: thiamine/thiamine pyrophosphate ABC transporter permease ThiP [Paracoccaceae bacterium]
MAGRTQQIRHYWPGLSAAAFVAILSLGTLAAVALRAEGWSRFGPSDWAAIRFTLLQALLSAAISVALAIPVARALARQRFWGRSALVTLLGAPFILPVIVAVLGLLSVFGRNGIISVFLGWFGLPPLQIYGFHGVVLAHVFFNLPLATRFFLQGWLAIPAERFRLAATLGFTTRDVGRELERPMLRAVLPGTFMVIFVICTTSFAVALALGGGPKATTVELAIYQAFRFDFDLGKAAMLAMVQFAFCLFAAGIALKVHVPEATGGGLDRVVERFDGRRWQVRIADTGWIIAAALFLMLPLAMIVLRGVPGLAGLSGSVLEAAARSVLVALGSVGLAVVLALSMALAIHGLRRRRWLAGPLEGIGYLAIATSPLVLGTGLFLVIFPFANPVSLALPITAMVNAVMSLPFILRALVPAVSEIEGRFGALADSLGMSGWVRFRYLLLPRLRRPLGFSVGLAAALSMGDLGVIALFSDPDAATLPLQMYRLMAAYRMQDAAGAALLLLVISLSLFWVFDRGGRVDADA